MDIHGYPWMSMDIHGCPWMSMDIPTHGHQWTSMAVHGYKWISMDIQGCTRISMDIIDIYGYLWISIIHGHPKTFMNIHGLSIDNIWERPINCLLLPFITKKQSTEETKYNSAPPKVKLNGRTGLLFSVGSLWLTLLFHLAGFGWLWPALAAHGWLWL